LANLYSPDALGGPETLLVFAARQPMVLSMDKPWYRKFFSAPPPPVLEATPPDADLGNAEVQFGMGLKFANATGEGQDYVQAAEWYRKAADQSHSQAQFNLGMMYANGQGVTRDDAQSAIWYGRAAQQGDASAQFNFGRSCHRTSLWAAPEAAPESRIEAYKWYQLAAAQGYKATDVAIVTLILSMTREDVDTGNQRVAAFQLTHLRLPE
jgi:TPR repeat protein